MSEEHTHATTGDTVVAEGHDGFWLVTADEHGWLTLARPEDESETTKARPSTVELVPADEEDEEETIGAKKAKTLAAYKPRYKPCVTASGNKSLNNGDWLAALLEGVSPELTARLADAACDEEPGHHAERYAERNPGAVRMNSGNKIRARLKNGTFNREWLANEAKKLGIIGDATLAEALDTAA